MTLCRRLAPLLLALLLPAAPGGAQEQERAPEYELLRHKVAIGAMGADAPPPAGLPIFEQNEAWFCAKRKFLDDYLPSDHLLRRRRLQEGFLRAVLYESLRAGVYPDVVMAIIEVESAFRKYAVSTAGAHGYMQVMPFWLEVMGREEVDNLFYLRVNLRYGTVILRHYMDADGLATEEDRIKRGLQRYYGDLRRLDYYGKVVAAYQRQRQHKC